VVTAVSISASSSSVGPQLALPPVIPLEAHREAFAPRVSPPAGRRREHTGGHLSRQQGMPIAPPLLGMLFERLATRFFPRLCGAALLKEAPEDTNCRIIMVICVILNDYANFIALAGPIGGRARARGQHGVPMIRQKLTFNADLGAIPEVRSDTLSESAICPGRVAIHVHPLNSANPPHCLRPQRGADD
jgi:hypothetical protein